MRQILLALVLLPLLVLQVRADDTKFSVFDLLNKLPVKDGVMFDVGHSRALNTLGVGLVTYKGAGIDLAYIGIDGIGAVLEYDLSNLPVQNVPVLQYVKFLNIGYAAGIRTITIPADESDPKSDNQLIHGPVLFFKAKF